jgi:hypothetical protein
LKGSALVARGSDIKEKIAADVFRGDFFYVINLDYKALGCLLPGGAVRY